jgi:hypothetical protein
MLETSGLIDLFKQLTGSSSPTTSTDSSAIGLGLDPSSPDILKEVAKQITKMKETGAAPDAETAKTLGAAFKSHLDYKANLSLLEELNKAYTKKFGASTKKGAE